MSMTTEHDQEHHKKHMKHTMLCKYKHHVLVTNNPFLCFSLSITCICHELILFTFHVQRDDTIEQDMCYIVEESHLVLIS